MGQQCYKCNSVAKGDARACEACGAPFGPIPPAARARWALGAITILLVVTLAIVFIWVRAQ